jgi:RNase P subunit RPR2
MKCICCLNESTAKKSFKALDRKIYQEFTKIELKIEQKALICIGCKELLKSSITFLRVCLKSYEHFEVNDKKPEVKRPRRRKIKDESDIDDEPPPEPLNEDSDDDDELPISAIQQQLQKEKETLITSVQKSPSHQPLEEVQIEISEETSKSNKSSVKFLCQECGISFQTSQRLQIHSYTHSGVKNFECEYDACGKSFATSELHLRFFLELIQISLILQNFG